MSFEKYKGKDRIAKRIHKKILHSVRVPCQCSRVLKTWNTIQLFRDLQLSCVFCLRKIIIQWIRDNIGICKLKASKINGVKVEVKVWKCDIIQYYGILKVDYSSTQHIKVKYTTTDNYVHIFSLCANEHPHATSDSLV